MPVGLGKATRIMPVVVHSIKEYVCVMELHGDVSKYRLKEAIEYFTDKIYQRPPVKSSVKRTLRTRRIYEIELIEVKGRHVMMRVVSDPGTYMRKLCHDMGVFLGVGAHMRELRRIRSGPFTEKEAVKLHDLSEALYVLKNEGDEKPLREIIKPVELAVCQLPKIIVKDTAVSSILHGSPLYVKGILAFTEDAPGSKKLALFTTRGELIGLGKPLTSNWDTNQVDAIIEKDRPLVAPTVNIMDRNAYPRMWRRRDRE